MKHLHLFEQFISEESTTSETKIIEITDPSLVPQDLVDNPAIPGTYESDRATHDSKGQYADIMDPKGKVVYRIRPGKLNLSGSGVKGLITSDYNTSFSQVKEAETESGEKVKAKAYFKEDGKFGEDVVPNTKDKWIGFLSDDGKISFACFKGKDGKMVCKEYFWKPA